MTASEKQNHLPMVEELEPRYLPISTSARTFTDGGWGTQTSENQNHLPMVKTLIFTDINFSQTIYRWLLGKQIRC
jgi:hypothetical protein